MGQNKDGRGNACPVTIIMPTLAMQAKEKTIAQFGEENSSEAFKMTHISNFMKLLDKKIGEAKTCYLNDLNGFVSSHQNQHHLCMAIILLLVMMKKKVLEVH